MGQWVCNNTECEKCGIVITEPIEKIIVIDGKVVSDALQCPVCKEDRLEVGEKKIPTRVSLHGKNLSNS